MGTGEFSAQGQTIPRESPFDPKTIATLGQRGEEELLRILDHAAALFLIADENGFLYHNKAVNDYTGLTDEELSGALPWRLHHQEDCAMVQKNFESILQNEGPPILFEHRMTSKDGRSFWMQSQGVRIQYRGRPAALISAVDISERKRGERLREALYQISNLAGEIADLRTLLARIHQIVSGLMYARNFYVALLCDGGRMLYFPYFVDEMDEETSQPQPRGHGLTDYVLRTGRPLLVDTDKFQEMVLAGEVELLGASSLDWLGVPLIDAGEAFGVLAVQSYDESHRFGDEEQEILLFVSEQIARSIANHRQRRALERSEQRYRSQIEYALHGVCRSTLDGRFLDVNPALVRMLGYNSSDELLALDLPHELWRSPEERERLIGSGEEIRISGFETRLRRKDGQLIDVRLSGHSGLRHGDEPPTLQLIIEDVTSRRALEAQLQHSQKLEAIGLLAGGVAHDFNNLLNVILSCDSQLLALCPPGSPMRQEAEEIGKAVERATALTRQLLAFGRRQELSPQSISLNAVLRDIHGLLTHLVGGRFELRLELEERLRMVFADRGQIEQIVMNLAVNACDAMQTGGRLTISTANLPAPPERFVHMEGPCVRLSVRDTGCGMSQELLRRIFEPFFTTKDADKGSGLGLSTAYGIARQSGGELWAESAEGRGSCFHLCLPALPASEGAGPTPRGDLSSAEAGARRGVLLVEDDEALRELIARILRRAGFEVMVAENGEQALECACLPRPPADLLLCDLQMPGMNGDEIARRVRISWPTTRALFISGHSRENAFALAPELDEAAEFLHKPFTPNELLERVAALLEEPSTIL